MVRLTSATFTGGKAVAGARASMARQIIYVFNDDPGTQEIKTDPDDSIKIPASGARYSHNGKLWLVGRVESCQMVTAAGLIRTVRICLNDI
jgi:hypothetical protein